MPSKSKVYLHTSVLRVSRLHFLYVLALSAQLVIFDIWHVTTLEATMQRWIAIGVLLAITAVVWGVVRSSKLTSPVMYRWLTVLLVAADIALAACYVYWDRGMASTYAGLFIIPILTASAMMSRAALVATACVCIGAYFAATYSYFVIHFNEGYKSQLYGTLFFWALIYLLVAFIGWSMIKAKRAI